MYLTDVKNAFQSMLVFPRRVLQTQLNSFLFQSPRVRQRRLMDGGVSMTVYKTS